MTDLNEFIFTGRLGADAVTKKLLTGATVLEVSAAINTGYGDFKKTLWVKLQRFGDRMPNVCPIFTKGSLVSGEGSLSTNEWQGADGAQHFDVVVNCAKLNLIMQKGGAASKPQEDVPEPDADEVVF